MISIIIPFYNEEENLPALYDQITAVCKKNSLPYELILIDDGSVDKGASYVAQLAKKDSHVVFIKHRTRFWKGAALVNGIKEAKGDIIMFMDADLQDDPDHIPAFVEKINEGYDLVNGWRKNRKDNYVKTLPSKVGNWFFIRFLFRSHLHDINCGYKALRKEVLDEIVLYGDNFRFLPLLAEKKGFKVTELVVNHHTRTRGVSKYGFFRRFTAFADILSAYFLYRFSEKPLHFFGMVGSVPLLIGVIMTIVLLIERTFFGMLLYRRPLFTLGIFLIIVGIQIIMTGVIGELIVYLHKKEQRV